MQSVQQRSPANFNNPFQSSNNAPHYRMEDSTSSRRGDQSATLPEFNGQNNIESQAEEVVIDFRPNTTENVLNLQSNNTEMNPDFTSGINPEGLEANVLINGNNAPNQNAIEKMIKDLLVGILRWNLFSMFAFGISILVLTVGLPYLYLLVFLWLWNTYNIVTLSHNSAITHANRRKNALGIVSNLLSAIFKVFVIIHIETNALMLTIPLVPVLVSEVVFSLVSCVTNRKSPTSLFYKFELVFKFLLVAQAAMIALKIDNIIDWHWREVFSAYWVMFAATAGLGFGFFLMFTGKCCAYVFADIEMNQVRGIFWFFFVVGGKTALSCALVLEGINILQNGSELDNILGILIAIPVYSACVLIYTGIYFKEIEAIWRRLAAVDPQPFEDEEAEQKDKAVNKIEPEKVDIPKFLTKFSSTYFRRSTDDEVESAKTKQNKKSNNKDQGKTHKTTKRRQNSVDYQRVRNATNVTGHSTTNINLLTVPETEVERTKTTDWNNTSRFGLVRPDKGKDFFASLTDRTGVSGIIPSGIMTSKTDRFQTGVTEPAENKDYSPLTSNDSYLLPPVSKDTEAPFRPYRHNKDKRDQLFLKDARTPDLTTANTPDVSPLAFSPLGIIDDGAEIEVSQITLSKMHRRVQSMQDVSPTQIISLSEALESPKVKESARDHPEPLKSPASDQSQGVQCLICFDNVPDAVFMECGHGGVCYECSLEIWKSTNECYLCRNTITQVLQVDLKAKLPNHVIKVLSSTQMVLYEEEEEVA